jgi:tetratricopeptide (TPR) repeat protein
MRISVLLICLLMLSAVPRAAEPALECGLAVYQTDTTNSSDVLLLADTVQVVQGIPASGYFLFFSIDLEVVEIDSAHTRFSVHLVTLAPSSQAMSRMFSVEMGLPARLSGISGKGGATYSLAVTPLRRIEVDTSDCPYLHRGESRFQFQPSANIDIYYLPQSFGDYNWGVVKGLLEEQYRQFQALCGFNLPGKYMLFLCPCYVRSTLWDDRFGMAIDPTRRTSSVLFSREGTTVDAFVINHAALLRNWGYAPPVLSEGFAGMQSFPLLDIKEILRQGRFPRMMTLLKTHDYYGIDPFVSDRAGASLVRFLIQAYGLPTFKGLYQRCDDLNLPDQLETTCGKSLSMLEEEWYRFVDTATVNPVEIAYHADVAEALFNYPLMLRYAASLESYAANANDSLRWLTLESRAAFNCGDYYLATEAQEKLVSMDTTSASRLMVLATYRQVNAYYDEARESLERAQKLDSVDHLIKFNLALNHLYRGDTAQAVGLLQSLVTASQGMTPSAECRIVLAELLRDWRDAEAESRREGYLDEAITMLTPVVRAEPTATSAQLWLGIACLLRGRADVAASYLQIADFLETRVFYRGMIALWLGKVADVAGDRPTAKEHYARALNLPTAAFVQDEARRYLETPYSL